MAENTTNPLLHSFCGSGVQAQLNWILCLGHWRPAIQVSATLHSSFGVQGLLPRFSGGWQNSAPCGHRTDIPIILVTVSWGLLSAHRDYWPFLGLWPHKQFTTWCLLSSRPVGTWLSNFQSLSSPTILYNLIIAGDHSSTICHVMLPNRGSVCPIPFTGLPHSRREDSSMCAPMRQESWGPSYNSMW